MKLSLGYGWTFDEVADMTIPQIMVASNMERKPRHGRRRVSRGGKGGGAGPGTRAGSGSGDMMSIGSMADVQAFLSRQQIRELARP